MREPWDFLAKYWRRIITPSGGCLCGYSHRISLFTVGARSFGGGYADDFGSPRTDSGYRHPADLSFVEHLCQRILKTAVRTGRPDSGYVIAIFLGKVDLSLIMSGGIISFPHLLPFMPEFHTGAIISACIIFLVSAAETIGDTSALVSGGLNREITGKEISGSLACDGYASASPPYSDARP